MEDQYHYQVIARALDYLRANAATRPSLEDIAAAQNLSPFHFQRVFQKWVGVTPKTYLEHLQLSNAKASLRARMSNLIAAEQAGLSGTGRLYDLMIKWEGMTPGEFAKAGAAMQFEWGVAPSPFGEMLVIAGKRGLVALAFVMDGLEETLGDYQRRWPQAQFVEDQRAVASYVEVLSQGRGTIELQLIGSPFQLQIWRALLSIPEGQFSTYGDLAQALGKPKAARAVGTAVGRNPISWLIPCHRVIRQTGELGGYHWGLPRKEAMIAYEAARAAS